MNRKIYIGDMLLATVKTKDDTILFSDVISESIMKHYLENSLHISKYEIEKVDGNYIVTPSTHDKKKLYIKGLFQLE